MGFLEFCVSASTEHDEFVGIVGSSPAIGEWQLSNAKKLTYDKTASKWKIKIGFGSPDDLVYRYFIANAKSNGKKETVIVKKWESGPSMFARKATVPTGGNETVQIDDGTFGNIDDQIMLDRGWLSGHTEVRFTFSDNGEAPMVSLRKGELSSDQLQISLEVEGIIARSEANTIRPYEYSKCNAVDKVRLPKNDDEVLSYVIEVANFESFSGHFTLYDKDGNAIGNAAIMSDQLQESFSYFKTTIWSKTGRGIGSLHMEYAVIEGCDNKEAWNMKEGFGSYWRKRPTLHIGHRGSGNSFTAKTRSDIYENTLSSFRRASAHSAAMIEFDVQLTKDLIPIVFHDFTICATVSSKKGGNKKALHEVEVQSLTYDQLIEYQTRHRARRDTSSIGPEFDEDDSRPDLRPFPTLKEVLEEVPEQTGFDIELKWPEYHLDKSWVRGVKKFSPANEFVDRILDVVFKYCGNRRIFFSSFDPNICVFLRRKQNRFPVVFLVNERDLFMDLRCRFNRLAIPFAASEGLLGICFHEHSAYDDEELVEKVHRKKLLAMFYGDRISEKEGRDFLIQQGADGIIYDRIHQALQQGPNIFQLTESSASLNN